MDVESFGPPNNHGDNPNGPAPGGTYDPQYIVVVHLQADGWNVHGIHAHFSATGLDPAGRIALASNLMEAKLKGGHPRFDYSGAPEQPYVLPNGSYAQYEDFKHFAFGSQHDVYLFFEHVPGQISFANGDIAEFSGYFRNGKAAEANHAFYEASNITQQIPASLAQSGSMILIENYFTRKGGQPIGKDEAFTYKLCLNYLAASGIAMMIDPQPINGGDERP
jgi:hypothetical protein